MGAIDYLNQHGLNAENLIDDQIAVWPEESITAAMELWIIEHKAQLVSELRGSGHNPDEVLLEIAQTLQADVHRLTALLSDDDMQDIADGHHSHAYLLAYFRLMRTDGHKLSDDTPEPTRAPEHGPRHVDLMKAWKPAHDALINHLMACPTCYAPLSRYCPEGSALRQAYAAACPSIAPAKFRNPSTHNAPEVTAP